MSCHESNAPTILRFALITVSDTRTKATDLSGLQMANLITANGHEITSQSIVPDEPTIIEKVIRAHSGSADVLCLSGGTGISRRDQTYEAVSALLERTLPGFGELFRMLSWQQVGSRAMLSRAIAGIYGSLIVFSLPGSPKAVVLAMEKLILPEARHIVSELRKH